MKTQTVIILAVVSVVLFALLKHKEKAQAVEQNVGDLALQSPYPTR